MSLDINWTPKATEGFNAILSFVEDNYSTSTTDKLFDDVQQWLARIKILPSICPLSKQHNIRKCVVKKHYLLLYKIVPNTTIQVVAFIDARSNHSY